MSAPSRDRDAEDPDLPIAGTPPSRHPRADLTPFAPRTRDIRAPPTRNPRAAGRRIFNQPVDFLPRPAILNHMVNLDAPSLDRVFHALAHPARRAILEQLADRERNLTELAAPLRMSFPAASKHVRVLERARLVRRRVVGRSHLCRAEGEPLRQASDWLEEYRRVWEANFQRLDALLEELQASPKKPRHTPK